MLYTGRFHFKRGSYNGKELFTKYIILKAQEIPFIEDHALPYILAGRVKEGSPVPGQSYFEYTL